MTSGSSSLPVLENCCDEGVHGLLDGCCVRRAAHSTGEEQVSGSDERGGERRGVGVGSDAAAALFGVQVGGDHGGGLGHDRDASGPSPGEAGAQSVPADDKTNDCHGQRLEDGDQGAGEVAGDAADARCVTKGRSVTVDLGGSIHDQLGEEGVEVREVSVQDTLGDPSLCGHGPARQRRRSLAAQDPLGGLEQHLAWVL